MIHSCYSHGFLTYPCRPSFLEAIVPMLDPRLVHMEKRCISLSTLSSGSYALHFADGSTYEADLVIGADGIKSIIREFVTGKPTSLVHSNCVAYRSVVPSEAFKAVKTDMMRPLCWIGKDKASMIKPKYGLRDPDEAARYLAYHIISHSSEPEGLFVLYL